MKYLKKFNESVEDIDSICQKYGIETGITVPEKIIGYQYI